eukprot:TRINITY_DN58536_c0_g1_i1.p1 TRINITY_DN58536_c0_g1~~TRINITY_DN58536_c0_g1_i1.p1  ORF type:complete len:113 (-),score=23.25 TRINITY_DN58536_c0_g1_i1:156-494(-)
MSARLILESVVANSRIFGNNIGNGKRSGWKILRNPNRVVDARLKLQSMPYWRNYKLDLVEEKPRGRILKATLLQQNRTNKKSSPKREISTKTKQKKEKREQLIRDGQWINPI